MKSLCITLAPSHGPFWLSGCIVCFLTSERAEEMWRRTGREGCVCPVMWVSACLQQHAMDVVNNSPVCVSVCEWVVCIWACKPVMRAERVLLEKVREERAAWKGCVDIHYMFWYVHLSAVCPLWPIACLVIGVYLISTPEGPTLNRGSALLLLVSVTVKKWWALNNGLTLLCRLVSIVSIQYSFHFFGTF